MRVLIKNNSRHRNRRLPRLPRQPRPTTTYLQHPENPGPGPGHLLQQACNWRVSLPSPSLEARREDLPLRVLARRLHSAISERDARLRRADQRRQRRADPVRVGGVHGLEVRAQVARPKTSRV